MICENFNHISDFTRSNLGPERGLDSSEAVGWALRLQGRCNLAGEGDQHLVGAPGAHQRKAYRQAIDFRQRQIELGRTGQPRSAGQRYDPGQLGTLGG